jgi:hypothetical protein
MPLKGKQMSSTPPLSLSDEILQLATRCFWAGEHGEIESQKAYREQGIELCGQDQWYEYMQRAWESQRSEAVVQLLTEVINYHSLAI